MEEKSQAGSTMSNSNISIDVMRDRRPDVQEKVDGVESTNSLTESGDEYPHGFVLCFIVVALVLSIFLVALDMTIVATAIPRITDEFKSVDAVGWYGSAFFLTLASFQSSWGKLYRYCNLKTSFLVAGLIFEIGSLICGIAKNSTTLIVGRAIAGWGAAGLVGGCYTIIAYIAPPNRRPAYTGLVGTSYGTASVVGPLLGGVFTDTISWRWCFYINLPIGAVALGIILLLFRLPTSAKPTPASWKEVLLQLDPLGTSIIIAAVTCFLLGTQWAGITRSWDSPSVIIVWVVFGVLTILFIGVQLWQQEKASLVPRILGKRVMTGICIFVFFQSGANFLITYFLPIYFQAIDGVSAAQSGIRNLPFIVLSSVFAALSGIAIVYVGYFTAFLAIGSAIFTVGSGLLYTLDIGSALSKSLGYQVILGFGQGLAIQIPVITGQAFSRPEDIPQSTAIVLFFQMMGGSIMVSAGQSIFGNQLLKRLASVAPHIDAGRVLETGASELRQRFAAGEIDAILGSYMRGLQDVFALSIAIAGCAFLASWIAPIKSIKQAASTVSSIAA